MIDLSQVRIAIYAYAYWQARLREPHDRHRNKVQLAHVGKWPRSGRWRRHPRSFGDRTQSMRQAVTELSSIWRSIPKPVQRAAHNWLRCNPEPITCGHQYMELVVNKVIKMCHACYADDDTRNRLIAQQAKRMMFARYD